MAFKVSDQAKREAHKAQQARRLESKLYRIERLKAKALEDPEGIWSELLAEAREGLET